ncbi:hypothetical protein [Terracidiphilus sp.]|uniref:hypothetical protein n=1 Tax=Terracidiphilus sp. TaxID=1964191 RepID=UPI003C1F9EC0
MVEVVDSWPRWRLAAETQLLLNEIASDICLAAYEPTSIRPGGTRLVAQRYAVETARRLEPALLGIAELAPEEEKSGFRGLLNWQAASESEPNDLTETKSRVTLENLVRVRIGAFQQALSHLKLAEHDE